MVSAVIPFQISVGGRSSAGYGLRATGAGRVVETRLQLPALPSDPAALGLALGQALFPVPVRQLLIELAHEADAADARLQIQLSVTPSELAALPWEWATLGGATPWSPAVRDDYALVRVGRSVSRPRPALTVTGPLRLLVACAPGPATRAAGPLGHALAAPVQAGSLVIDLLRDADPAALREALNEELCHALHLVVGDATGTGITARLRLGRGLDAAGLATLLEGYPDLRLLTLAADPGAEVGALAALAAAVHDTLGIAVVTLGDLAHAEAGTFSGACYAAVAAGTPVDLAVTDGRAALEASGGAWGEPRLWLMSGGEHLFIPTPAAAPQTPPSRRSSAPEPPPPPPPTAPVGTPVRPSRDAASLRRTATKALDKARAFVVAATAVGEPAQRSRSAEPGPGLLQPKLVVLLVAFLILALMISRVLPDRSAAPPALPTPTPTISLLRPTMPVPVLPPTAVRQP